MKINVCKEITAIDLNAKPLFHYKQVFILSIIIKGDKQNKINFDNCSV